MKVWVLESNVDGDDDHRIVGIFSTREKLERAREARANPEDFSLDDYELDTYAADDPDRRRWLSTDEGPREVGHGHSGRCIGNPEYPR